MKLRTDQLISELTALTHQNIEDAEYMLEKSMQELNWKVDSTGWSALECIAHLNRYSDFYLPELKYRINQQNAPSEDTFIPGFFGNYFANTIRLNERMKKMKTPKEMNPLGSILSKDTLLQFIVDQHAMISLLEDAKSISLNKTKTAISISKLIKLKLGDTLRFVVYHNERHMLQALRALDLIRNKAA